MSLHPFHSDRLILNPAGLAGVLTVLHLCMDLKNTLLGKHHYVLFYITAAMNPRMLMTVRDEVEGSRSVRGKCPVMVYAYSFCCSSVACFSFCTLVWWVLVGGDSERFRAVRWKKCQS